MTVLVDPNSFFSFGGGTQSTAIALLLCHKPEMFTSKGLTLPQHIIFADTGAEPDHVYEHIKKVSRILIDHDFEFHTVSKPNDNILSDRGLSTVPWFFNGENGVGMLRRQCTNEYKITPIERKIRELLGYQKGERIPVGKAKLWIGISVDEIRRVAINRSKWILNQYPLIAAGLTRTDCSIYAAHIMGYAPPKSACFFCPFTHRQEWINRKKLKPELYAKAVEVDERIRNAEQFGSTPTELFVHFSAKPLNDLPDQMLLELGEDFGFANACEGHCGV